MGHTIPQYAYLIVQLDTSQALSTQSASKVPMLRRYSPQNLQADILHATSQLTTLSVVPTSAETISSALTISKPHLSTTSRYSSVPGLPATSSTITTTFAKKTMIATTVMTLMPITASSLRKVTSTTSLMSVAKRAQLISEPTS